MKGTRNKRINTSIFSLCIYLLIWKLLSVLIGRSILLPSPEMVVLKTIAVLGEGESWMKILASSIRALGGFSMSFILGCLTGLAAGKSQGFGWLTDPFVISIRSIPVLSLILLAIIWFPTEFVPVFICFLVVYPLIHGAVARGVKQVDPELLEMARIYNKSSRSIHVNIIFPSVIPYLLSAVSAGLGYTWKSVVAAEILSMPKRGLGTAMQSAQLQLETELLFSWTLIVVLLAAFCEFLVQRMEIKR